MKILSEPKSEISVFSMKDGEIAVITRWCASNEAFAGYIVQRFGDTLITLGECRGKSWLGFFKYSLSNCFVRILPTGTQIEL